MLQPTNYLLALIGFCLIPPIALARTFTHADTFKLLSLFNAVFLTSKRRSAALIIWIRGSLHCIALTPTAMGIVAHLGSLLHRLGPLSRLPPKNYLLQYDNKANISYVFTAPDSHISGKNRMRWQRRMILMDMIMLFAVPNPSFFVGVRDWRFSALLRY